MFQVESLHYKSSLMDVKMVYVLLWVWTQAYMCSPLSVKGEGGGGAVAGRLESSEKKSPKMESILCLII